MRMIRLVSGFLAVGACTLGLAQVGSGSRGAFSGTSRESMEVKDKGDMTVAYLSANTRTRIEQDLTGRKIVVSPANSEELLRNLGIKDQVRSVDIQVGSTKVGDPVYVQFFAKETGSQEPGPNTITGGNWLEIAKSMEALKSPDMVVLGCEGKYVCVRPPSGKPKCEQWRCVKL